jgi:hypothetical protein
MIIDLQRTKCWKIHVFLLFFYQFVFLNTHTLTTISGTFWTMSRVKILQQINDSETMGDLGLLEPTVSVREIYYLSALTIPGR